MVEIGADADGEPITSCVVTYGKKPKRCSNSASTAKLSVVEETAIKALLRASIKYTEQTADKYGANTEKWRSFFYKLRKNENNDIEQNTLKVSFGRAQKRLLELGHIEQVENLIALTGSAHQAKIKQKIDGK